MPTVPLYDQEGNVIGELDLSDKLFGIEPHADALHRAVVLKLASERQGTHATKTRGEVRGGGRKPWRQKGTGRARHGSIRSPLWVGGGVTHGPKPREYGFSLPKKLRRLALASALSLRVRESKLWALDRLALERPRTKEMVRIFRNLQLPSKVLVILGEEDANVELSARNLPGVKVVTWDRTNTYDILNHEALVATVDAIRKLEEVFAR